MKSHASSAPVNAAAWMGQATGWSYTVMRTEDAEPLAPEGTGDGSPSSFNCTVMKTLADEGARRRAGSAPPVNWAAWLGPSRGLNCTVM